MEPTNIVLIVVFAICGMVLLWAFKNANNIKFKKREKKAKADKKEKFKEVLPKEKPIKEKKEKKDKIRDAVKEEKSGRVEPPTNRVTKVTKEDFKSNDIELPQSIGSAEKQTSEFPKEEFKLPDDFKLPPLKEFKEDDFKFDDEFLKSEFPGFDPMLNDLGMPMDAGYPMDAFPFMPVAEEDSFDFSPNPSMKLPEQPMNSQPEEHQTLQTKGKILNESIEDRINKVFGNISLDASEVKEVMVSEVLTGNRSRINRELREKRKKWMK